MLEVEEAAGQGEEEEAAGGWPKGAAGVCEGWPNPKEKGWPLGWGWLRAGNADGDAEEEANAPECSMEVRLLTSGNTATLSCNMTAYSCYCSLQVSCMWSLHVIHILAHVVCHSQSS